MEKSMAKEFAKQFYNSAKWKRVRETAIQRDHGMCQTPGCYNPAEEVHHIIELTPDNIDDPRVSLSLDNLQSLCHDCHTRLTMSKDNPKLERIYFENGVPKKY